jgi:fumarylacetoacetate (FAA) hydrolase
MKLATLRDGSRDGRLVVARRDGKVAAIAPEPWITLQRALDEWERAEPALREVAAALDSGELPGVLLEPGALAAPLPRTYEWVDGSAYLNHVILVRKARGAEPPPTLTTDPLVYQGGGSDMLGPRDPIPLADVAWGLDYESEVCVVLGDVAQGVSAADAAKAIRLVMICNDCTLRHLVPPELAKGFGFFQSKPATAFAPFAVTPDELGDAWKDGRVHLPLVTRLNGVVVGDPEAGPEMHFGFFELIAHLARTRAYTAGTILGSGTVSNEDPARGISCLAERRMREILEHGEPRTPFLVAGDHVQIAMADRRGRDLFGTIDQRVVAS